MAIVTSTEFRKQFGHFSAVARREPLIITERKRESLVVLSYDEYSRLKAMDARRAYHLSDLPMEFLQALESVEPPKLTEMYDNEVDA